MEKFTEYISSSGTYYARSIVLNTLRRLQWGLLRINYTNQEGERETIQFGSQVGDVAIANVTVKDDKVWQRLCSNMDIGMSEAFMLNEVECDDLVALFTIYIKNKNALGVGPLFFQMIPRLQRILFGTSNTIENSLKNSISHYDTSNDLFAGFLSTDMNYSCPIWSPDDPSLPSNSETLEAAQQRKVHNIIHKANIQGSDHVLDIGCGWANLAIEAVRLTGCRVRGVMLSAVQKELAEERIKLTGYEDKIDICLCDYREIPPVEGGYDKIVSVEMLEHIGKEHLKTFFETITRLLKPGVGKMVVQGITVTNERRESKPNLDTFIDRYIFPGGYLPTAQMLLDSIHNGSKGKLEIRGLQSLGPHYIRALRLWREKFLANWEAAIKPALMRDNPKGGLVRKDELEPVKRKWEYYFSCCEAGFRTNMLGDCVITAQFRDNQDLFSGVPL
ncbi:cyclopropane-fatty-acyl-phospholipid synthase [Phlyctema vagabunda]|uniref:Cyclopropane-fatty-acyl-phospholipid synthase n=1 Tax=Phlyctema vagabunda TaxID=108571 RepID=A0ABR4PVV0_9HELO